MKQKRIARSDENIAQTRISVGQAEANRVGLTGELAADCAAAFVLHCCEQEAEGENLSVLSAAQMRQRAHWFALDQRRRFSKRQFREIPWLYGEAYNGDAECIDFSNGNLYLCPVQSCLQQSCEDAIYKAINDLEATPRLLFVLRVFLDVPYIQLGVHVGKTEEAARKIVTRAARRVQAQLKQNGWSEADLHEALRDISPEFVSRLLTFAPTGVYSQNSTPEDAEDPPLKRNENKSKQSVRFGKQTSF